jgi:hypothetical protein
LNIIAFSAKEELRLKQQCWKKNRQSLRLMVLASQIYGRVCFQFLFEGRIFKKQNKIEMHKNLQN